MKGGKGGRKGKGGHRIEEKEVGEGLTRPGKSKRGRANTWDKTPEKGKIRTGAI